MFRRRIYFIRKLWRIIANKRDLMRFIIWAFIRCRYWPKSIVLEIRVLNKVHSVIIRGIDDLAVLEEVFVDGEYQLSGEGDLDGIIDLGAHAGFASIYLKTVFDSAKLLSVEPDIANYRSLTQNLQKFDSAELMNLAVSEKEEIIPLYIKNKASFSISHLENDSDRSYVGNAVGMPIDWFLAKFDVDSRLVLKFDVEGAEKYIYNIINKDSRIIILLGEHHEDLSGIRIHDTVEMLSNYEITWESLGSGRFILRGSRIR